MEIIKFEREKKRILLLDQTLLPEKIEYIKCEDLACLEEAIKSLRIRGAPAIGVAAAFGVALVGEKNKTRKKSEIINQLKKAGGRLKKTRPTAVNLSWAVERVLNSAVGSGSPSAAAVEEAFKIYNENKEADRKIAKYGAKLIKDGDVILTHCNTGSLATSGEGTALGVIKEAFRQGKNIKVIATETRPLLQGARLTSFELVEEKIPVRVVCDSAAAFFMKNKEVSRVIVGADRIARNGDTANKIGTYMLAVLAKEHGLDFYIAAPSSTIDYSIETGDEIKIEFRKKEEIEFFNRKRILPKGAEVFNPAFDITPARYITAFITEKGVVKPPFNL